MQDERVFVVEGQEYNLLMVHAYRNRLCFGGRVGQLHLDAVFALQLEHKHRVWRLPVKVTGFGHSERLPLALLCKILERESVEGEFAEEVGGMSGDREEDVFFGGRVAVEEGVDFAGLKFVVDDQAVLQEELAPAAGVAQGVGAGDVLPQRTYLQVIDD